MNVVFGAPQGQNFDFQVLGSSEDVGIEGFLHICEDQVCTIFRAENTMDEIGNVGVRQGCRPSGTPGDTRTITQRLRAGLTNFAPSGAMRCDV